MRLIAVPILAATLAIGILAYMRYQQPGGEAGIAYTQNEQGELVAVDSTSSSEVQLTDAQRQAAFKGRNIEELNSMRRQADEQGLSNEQWARRFDLIERSGKKVSSEDLKGQPYIAGFFFTLCPTICTEQNGMVKQLQTRFQGQPIRLLSISCDPEVDRPAKLTEYASRFDADPDQWLFLTGTMQHIKKIGSEMFSLAVERRFHAEKFVLVDAEGDIVGFYAWGDPVQWQQLQSDMEELISIGGVFPRK